VSTAPHVALKTSAYAALSLAMILAFVFASGTKFSVWLAVCAAVASALVVLRSDRGRSAPKLIAFFLLHSCWACALRVLGRGEFHRRDLDRQ